MWQNQKALHSTSKHINYQPPPPTQIQNIPIPPAPIKLSRRQLAICVKSSLLLLTSQFQDQFYLPKAKAQDQNQLTLDNPQSLQDENPIDNDTRRPTEENPVDTSSTASPTEESPVETSTTTSPTEENPVENSGSTGPTEENIVETSETASSTEENPVDTSATTSPTEENQAETGGTTNTTTEENQVEKDSDTTATTEADSCIDKVVTKRAFLDISIDGKPIGRIVVGLYGNNVPAGTAKFSDFVSGAAGNPIFL